jgi:hypothetical protein
MSHDELAQYFVGRLNVNYLGILSNGCVLSRYFVRRLTVDYLDTYEA